MVSADGGKSWAQAALDGAGAEQSASPGSACPGAGTASPRVLQSRAWDEAGNVQPTRAEFVAERGEPKTSPPVHGLPMGHMNAITSWAIDTKGEVKHVYA